MIIIFGGSGFIGQHTAKYLSDKGEHVVVTSHSRRGRLALIDDDIAAGRIEVEQLDILDAFAVMGILTKYRPRVVIDLSGHAPKALAPRSDVTFRTSAWLNIFEAARMAGVSRVVMMSSMDSYWGLGLSQVPFREDMPVPLVEQDDHVIVQSWVKKALEVIGNLYRRQHGMEIVFPRSSGVYGPLYRTFLNFPSRLVRAAVRGDLDLAGDGKLPFAEDGYDQAYVKDIARGVGLIARAETLRHAIYNIGSGRAAPFGEFARAVEEAVPGWEITLPSRASAAGRDAPAGPMEGRWMDIRRARDELGYTPRFSLSDAIADYVAWMRNNEA